jgi:hypothetical protein
VTAIRLRALQCRYGRLFRFDSQGCAGCRDARGPGSREATAGRNRLRRVWGEGGFACSPILVRPTSGLVQLTGWSRAPSPCSRAPTHSWLDWARLVHTATPVPYRPRARSESLRGRVEISADQLHVEAKLRSGRIQITKTVLGLACGNAHLSGAVPLVDRQRIVTAV